MCSVRRRPHFVSLISFSLAWGLLVFMLVLPFTVSAAPVTYETVRVGPGQYAPNGTTSPVTFNVKTPGVSKFHQIVPVATPSTLGKLARKTLRGGGVGLAVAAAIEGLGYLIDKATGDITKLEREVVLEGEWISADSSRIRSCNSSTSPYYSGYQYYAYEVNSDCPAGSTYYRQYFWTCSANTHSLPQPQYYNRCYLSAPSETDVSKPITQADIEAINNKLNTALSLAEKTAIIKNAIATANPSGTVNSDNYPVTISGNSAAEQFYSDWPEFKTLLQQLVNAQTAAYLATVQPEFEVAPEDQAIVDNANDFAPPNVETPTLELPAFCEWASFICEPFTGGDQPDVPILDLEAPTFDSGLPQSASCPAPVSIDTQWFGSLELSYEPACQFASGIRVPLLAISYLVSGFIVVGVRR